MPVTMYLNMPVFKKLAYSRIRLEIILNTKTNFHFLLKVVNIIDFSTFQLENTS